MSQLLLSALAVVCPTCDGHNPPRAAACTLCGTALGEAPRTADRAPTPPVRPPAPGRALESVPPGLRPSSRTPLPATLLSVSTEPPPGVAAALRPASRPPGQPPPPPVQPPPPPVQPPPPPVQRPTPAGPTGLTPKAPGTPRPAPAASRFGLAIIAGSARGQRYKLPVTGCLIGRTRGAILLQDDLFVSPVHCALLVRDGALFVRDEGSASGVFVTIPGAEQLAPRTFFSAGQRLFRFNGRIDPIPPAPGRPTVYGAPVPLGQAVHGVEEMLMGGRGGRLVVTAAPLLTIGQAHCDLAYPGDEGLAGRHCELSPSPQGAILRDLSGGLGTYVRIIPRVERPLRPGDRVRLGQHILQVELLG